MAKNSGKYFITTSIADIAFLTLIFFLVATTIDIDTSLYRIQSSSSNQPSPELKKQNIMAVKVNSNDQLMDKHNKIPLSIPQQKTKESLINSQNKKRQPEQRIENAEQYGKIEISHFKTTSLYSVNYPCIVSLNL